MGALCSTLVEPCSTLQWQGNELRMRTTPLLGNLQPARQTSTTKQ